jgi:hypothetical protein
MSDDVLLTPDWEQFCAALHPCDVLVFDSLGFEAGLVQWADRAPVNHASLVLDAASVIEANRTDSSGTDPQQPPMGAVRQVSFQDRFANQAIRTTTALRHVDLLDPDSAVVGEVLARARADLGRREFAYLAVPALGPAALRRAYAQESDDDGMLKAAARLLLGAANEVLRRLSRQDRWSLSCSEFVYRCFTEIDNPLKIAVDMPLVLGGSTIPPVWLTTEQAAGEKQFHDALHEHNEKRVSAGPKSIAVTAPVADRVTPGDLWRSPKLRPVAVMHRWQRQESPWSFLEIPGLFG